MSLEEDESGVFLGESSLPLRLESRSTKEKTVAKARSLNASSCFEVDRSRAELVTRTPRTMMKTNSSIEVRPVAQVSSGDGLGLDRPDVVDDLPLVPFHLGVRA